MSDSSLPDVSVVIPTLGRPDLLERCLRALLRQTLHPERFEVVVVDDGRDEETRRLVQRLHEQSDVMLRYVHTPGHAGPAAARNVGWRVAQGRIIAFTDDDTVPSERWLEAGLRAFVNGTAGVAGRLVMPLPAKPTDYERDAAGLEAAEFPTANCFYKRGALEAIGGFDERFKAAWREDADVYFTLLERGYRMAEAPEAVVEHPVREAPWGVSLAQQRKTRYNALLYKKHPTLYRERIGRSPRWYYAAVFAVAGALLSLVIGRRRAAAVLGGAWLGMTGAFAAKRLSGTSKRPAHVAEVAVTSAAIPPVSLFWRLRGAIEFKVPFWS